jgi:hypothetical protein
MVTALQVTGIISAINVPPPNGTFNSGHMMAIKNFGGIPDEQRRSAPT